MTSIEWTDETWNPIVGCSRVSPGCENCYAERFVHRKLSPQHHGLTVLRQTGPGWTGEVRLVESALAKPLGWRKPRRVFVNSLSDLFHDALSNEQIAAVFGVMAACPHLTFQVLTKRPERMGHWFRWVERRPVQRDTHRDRRNATMIDGQVGAFIVPEIVVCEAARATPEWTRVKPGRTWPLPNVWLGVTAEDQQRADERIPLLLDTPAAVRFVSYEPALGPVDFGAWVPTRDSDGHCTRCGLEAHDRSDPTDICPPGFVSPSIDWLIVGGESGPGARPFDVAWARSAVARCRAAGVPCFVKQLGAWPIFSGLFSDADRPGYQKLRDRKGKDPSEWPEDLRVRDFPDVRAREEARR